MVAGLPSEGLVGGTLEPCARKNGEWLGALI